MPGFRLAMASDSDDDTRRDQLDGGKTQTIPGLFVGDGRRWISEIFIHNVAGMIL
jgi:hypothetical protein